MCLSVYVCVCLSVGVIPSALSEGLWQGRRSHRPHWSTSLSSRSSRASSRHQLSTSPQFSVASRPGLERFLTFTTFVITLATRKNGDKWNKWDKWTQLISLSVKKCLRYVLTVYHFLLKLQIKLEFPDVLAKVKVKPKLWDFYWKPCSRRCFFSLLLFGVFQKLRLQFGLELEHCMLLAPSSSLLWCVGCWQEGHPACKRFLFLSTAVPKSLLLDSGLTWSNFRTRMKVIWWQVALRQTGGLDPQISVSRGDQVPCIKWAG